MMKRMVMCTVILGSGFTVAETIDVTPFLGDNWYGLYFNGEKVGWVLKQTTINTEGDVDVVEDAHFMVNMSGVKQAMRMYSKRVYRVQGDLLRIEMEMTDPAQVSTFSAEVSGDKLRMKSLLGGTPREEIYPQPHESLRYAFCSLLKTA